VCVCVCVLCVYVCVVVPFNQQWIAEVERSFCGLLPPTLSDEKKKEKKKTTTKKSVKRRRIEDDDNDEDKEQHDDPLLPHTEEGGPSIVLPPFHIVHPTTHSFTTTALTILAKRPPSMILDNTQLRCPYFLTQKAWDQKSFPKDMFCKLLPSTPDRSHVFVHAKTASRRTPPNVMEGAVQMLYCGSHDLSAAAWGRLRATKFKDYSLTISNYELGVLFPPRPTSHLGLKPKKFPLGFASPAPEYNRDDDPYIHDQKVSDSVYKMKKDAVMSVLGVTGHAALSSSMTSSSVMQSTSAMSSSSSMTSSSAMTSSSVMTSSSAMTSSFSNSNRNNAIVILDDDEDVNNHDIKREEEIMLQMAIARSLEGAEGGHFQSPMRNLELTKEKKKMKSPSEKWTVATKNYSGHRHRHT